jgi:hypothetical protein
VGFQVQYGDFAHTEHRNKVKILGRSSAAPVRLWSQRITLRTYWAKVYADSTSFSPTITFGFSPIYNYFQREILAVELHLVGV